MLILLVMLLVMLGIFLFFQLRAGKKYREFIQEYKKELMIPMIAPCSLEIIASFNLMSRLHTQVAEIQQKMISLYGMKEAKNQTIAFLARLISIIFFGIIFVLIIGLAQDGDALTMAVIGIMVIMFPLFMVQDLGTKVKKRRVSIIYELPEFLSKMVLLINAGETVQKAFIRCVKTKEQEQEKDKSPLYNELHEAMVKVENNMPFSEVLNQLSKKCAVQEISMFTTTLLLNYRKGGDDLVRALSDLSVVLWEKRKAQAQIRGEEAASKMVAPLMIVFVIVMIIVGYPALALF